MSMLIMGLGITSVFTLFPLSIVRSLKATNLTNATLLAQSAREAYVANKSVFSLPPAKGAGGSYAHGKDGLLTTAPVVPDSQIPDPFVGTFLVDPYGGGNAASFGATPGRFGRVLRVRNSLAASDVTSPDTWVTLFEDLPTSIANGTDITLPATSGYSLASLSSSSRVVVLSLNGRRSVTRSVDVTNSTATLLKLTSRLPDDMDQASEVSLVRVQNFERRYTYVYTLHRTSTGTTTGQIAVFFRREFGDPELTYNATFNSQSYKQSRQVTVSGYSGRPTAGDYIFGSWKESASSTRVHGRWHRITFVADGATSGEFVLTLDRPWVGKIVTSSEPRVMFPKGVVGVFDL